MKKIIFVSFLAIFCNTVFSQDTAKVKEFKPSGKVWGYAFGDLYYKLHADSSGRGGQQYSGAAYPKDANSFEFRRIYLGYDYTISEKFSTELILAYEGQTLSDNATRTIFIKCANVRWKNIYKNADLVFGLMHSPAFPMLEEKIWSYRSIEKTLFDMRKIGSSTDLGLALQGKIDTDGNYGYNLMVGNGTAQKIETDRFKKMSGDVYAKFMNKKIVVDIYADYERSQLSPIHKSKMGFKGFLAYNSDKLTVGVEFFQQAQENFSIHKDSVTALKQDTTDIAVMGYGAFIRGTIIKDKLNFFARYDWYSPDTKYDNSKYYISYTAYNIENFISAGIDFMPVKNVHIIPNIWYDSYSSRFKNIKGLAKYDNDLVLRLTIHYIFK